MTQWLAGLAIKNFQGEYRKSVFRENVFNFIYLNYKKFVNMKLVLKNKNGNAIYTQ